MTPFRSFSLVISAFAFAAGVAAADEPMHDSSAPTYQGVPSSSADHFRSKPAMDVWADDLNYYVAGDNRINNVFLFNGDVQRQNQLKKNLEDLAMGAPVDVPKMVSDSGLTLTTTQYNAMIEDAYLACEASRTPYHVCNRMVTSLSPFERAVVSR